MEKPGAPMFSDLEIEPARIKAKICYRQEQKPEDTERERDAGCGDEFSN